jgi:hypothetical protein
MFRDVSNTLTRAGLSRSGNLIPVQSAHGSQLRYQDHFAEALRWIAGLWYGFQRYYVGGIFFGPAGQLPLFSMDCAECDRLLARDRHLERL